MCTIKYGGRKRFQINGKVYEAGFMRLPRSSVGLELGRLTAYDVRRSGLESMCL